MRVIALVDMDCFYCQVEEKLNPSLQGKPVAVVQYNLWREGGIIAANYLAKEKGVTKGMWMHEAKDLCPNIEFAKVAELRGRADLTKYRQAGKQVADVLSTFTNLIERASVDEAYLDLTDAVTKELSKGLPNNLIENLKTTHIVGCETSDFLDTIRANQDTDGFCENDIKVIIGAILVENIRAQVYEKTGYRCSAGIAHNKILAKLVCGLHKPNKQTVLPQNAINVYFSELPLKKIKRLGGKFGKKVSETLNIQHVGELLKFTEKELSNIFDDKTGHWLYSIARGIDNEPVSQKLISKSISCCKRFPGKNALFKYKDVEHWINELAVEVMDRLKEDQDENNRKARTTTLSFIKHINEKDISNSKTYPLKSYDAQKLAKHSLEVIKKHCENGDGSYHIRYLGIAAGQFEKLSTSKNLKYFLEQHTGKSINSNSIVKSECQISPTNADGKCEDSGLISTHTFPVIENGDQKKDLKYFFEKTMSKSDVKIEVEHTYQKCKQKTDIPTVRYTVSDNEEEKNFVVVENHKSVNDSEEQVTPNPSENCIFGKSPTQENFSETVSDHLKEVSNQAVTSDIHNVESSFNSSNSRNKALRESFFAKYFDKVNQKELDNVDDVPSKIDEQIPGEYIICNECGQEILGIDEFQHRDYHYAINLYKKDLTSAMSSSSALGLLGASVETSRKRRISDEEKKEDEKKGRDTDATIIVKICSECGTKLKLWEIDTHMDYHAAKKLHKELNSQSTSLKNNSHKSQTLRDNSILSFLRKSR